MLLKSLLAYIMYSYFFFLYLKTYSETSLGILKTVKYVIRLTKSTRTSKTIIWLAMLNLSDALKYSKY